MMQVMELRKRVLGKEHPLGKAHPDTLASMANVASTYRNQGQCKEAEKLEIQMMETTSKVQGKEHSEMLTAMANLASMYSYQGY